MFSRSPRLTAVSVCYQILYLEHSQLRLLHSCLPWCGKKRMRNQFAERKSFFSNLRLETVWKAHIILLCDGSIKSILFNSASSLYDIAAKAHARCIACISLHVSCRFFTARAFFNSNERDCIISSVECTRVQCFFRLFLFCLFNFFSFFSSFHSLSLSFSRISSTFYGILFSMQNWRCIKESFFKFAKKFYVRFTSSWFYAKERKILYARPILA